MRHESRRSAYTRVCEAYFRKADRRALVRLGRQQIAAYLITSVSKALDLQERLTEYATLYGSVIRRQAQVFQGTTDKVSEFIAFILRQVAFVALVLGVFVALAWRERYAPVPVASSVGQLAATIARLPSLDWRLWAFALALDGYLFAALIRLKRRFRERKPRLPAA